MKIGSIRISSTERRPQHHLNSAETDSYTRTAGTNRLASISDANGVRTISYDARGNMATETRPGSISVATAYDGYARLTSYTRTGEAGLTHAYNGLDDRVSTTRGTDTRRYVYDMDGRVIGEYGTSATDVKAEFIWLSPEVANDNQPFGGDDGTGGYAPLAVATGPTATPTLTWVHGTHLGVPTVYTDATGTATATPSGYDLPGFPGQSRTLADLYYNRYRDYDTTTGRYIQADPIGLDGDENPYTYAGADPVNSVDPMGLEKVIFFKEWSMWFKSKFDDDIPGVCTIYSHGSSRSLNGMSGPGLEEYLRHRGLCKGAKVYILKSCKTGLRKVGFAQEFADKVKRPVIAPDTYVWYSPFYPIGPFHAEKGNPNGRDPKRPGKYKTFYPRVP